MRRLLAAGAAAIAMLGPLDPLDPLDYDAIAQTPEPPAAPAIIVGRVIDGSTDRPISGVVVSMSPAAGSAPTVPPGGAGGPPPIPRMLTDASGRFVFASVAPGRYQFQVTGASGPMIGGYGVRRPGGPPQPFEIAAGARVTDVTVRVWRQASISGTLTDQFGDPLPETRVTALRVTIVGGMRRFTPGRTTVTDDRGAFFLSRLDPGEYTIYLPFPEVTIPASVQAAATTASQGGQAGREQFERSLGESGAPHMNNDGFRVGGNILVRGANMYGADGAIGPMLVTPPPDDAGSVLVYPITYFPGTTSFSEASTFVLESGQDRGGTDMQVRLVPSARVSGQVVGPDGPVGMVGVRLMPATVADAASDAAIEAASTITEANGAFTFLGVPAGQYTLKVARTPIPARPNSQTTVTVGGVTMFTSIPESELPPVPLAEGNTLSASMPISVADREVSNVLVMLRAGPRLTGRLEYDGSAAQLTTDQLLRLKIALEPVDGRTVVGGTGHGQFDANGRFTTLGLLPGRYVLRVNGNLESWWLESAMAGGRDITDAPIAIDAANVSDVVIKLSDHPAMLSGSVRNAAGVDPSAVVLLFPADRAAWTATGATLRRLRTGRVSPQGAYRIPNVPPGEYFAIAIDDRFGDNWQDPKRLEAFTRIATRITVMSGERKALDLMTETIR